MVNVWLSYLFYVFLMFMMYELFLYWCNQSINVIYSGFLLWGTQGLYSHIIWFFIVFCCFCSKLFHWSFSQDDQSAPVLNNNHKFLGLSNQLYLLGFHWHIGLPVFPPLIPAISWPLLPDWFQLDPLFRWWSD